MQKPSTPIDDGTRERVREIHALLEKGYTQTKIGRKLGLAQSTISGIIHRHLPDHVSWTWRSDDERRELANQIRPLLNDGRSIADVAEELDLPKTLVQRIKKEFDIPSPRQRR